MMAFSMCMLKLLKRDDGLKNTINIHDCSKLMHVGKAKNNINLLQQVRLRKTVQ